MMRLHSQDYLFNSDGEDTHIPSGIGNLSLLSFFLLFFFASCSFCFVSFLSLLSRELEDDTHILP